MKIKTQKQYRKSVKDSNYLKRIIKFTISSQTNQEKQIENKNTKIKNERGTLLPISKTFKRC